MSGKKKGNNNRNKAAPASGGKSSGKRQRREVKVVQCPSDFPTLSNAAFPSKKHDAPDPESKRLYELRQKRRREGKYLDWNDTSREIHKFGATAFEGKQKRDFQDEEYERLTGRKKKHQHVPLPIVRGIKKKRAEREQRRLDEAKAAGLVIPTAEKKKKKRDRTSEIHGPAPSIGFLSRGMLKLKQKP
jgi:hypothetical protein